jgi:hypothetical protein
MTQPEGLEDLRTVEEVVEYQTGYADYSAILNEADHTEVRVHWLKNLRNEWKLVDYHVSEDHDNGHVQFERKDE